MTSFTVADVVAVLEQREDFRALLASSSAEARPAQGLVPPEVLDAMSRPEGTKWLPYKFALHVLDEVLTSPRFGGPAAVWLHFIAPVLRDELSARDPPAWAIDGLQFVPMPAEKCTHVTLSISMAVPVAVA